MVSSLVTPYAKITPEKWAVTMVKDRGKQHARILFEGIEDLGEQFVQMAHLQGWRGRVKCFSSHAIGHVEMKDKWRKERFTTEDKYSAKTSTWILSRDKIESLMKKIENESGKGHPFFIAGKTSFLAKKAETYDIHNPMLGKLAKADESLFLKLYDSYCNEKKPTGMKEEEFNKAIAKIFDEDIECDYQYFMNLFDKEEVTAKETEEDNCFTWAKLQFKYLGIALEETKSFKIVAKLASVTSLQVFHPIKADGKDFVFDMTEDDSLMASTAMLPKPISHRTVTYEKKRDKRTEAFKRVDKETRGIFIKNAIGVSSFVAGAIVSGVGFWGGVGAACGVVATAPVSVPMTIGATVLACSGFIVSNFQSSKLDRLKEKIVIRREITSQEAEKFRKNIQHVVLMD